MRTPGKSGSSKLLGVARTNDRSFDEQVHELIARIPSGFVATYKDLADALGSRAYRAVGGACNRSPGMPSVPCHRVVATDGRLHGFAHGLPEKKRLLESEGVAVTGSGDAMRVDLTRYGFTFV